MPKESACDPPCKKSASNKLATSPVLTAPKAIRPFSVATSTIGSSQYIPREPLRTKLISRPRFCASFVIALATRFAPNETALESQGT